MDCISKADANPRKQKGHTNNIEELAYTCRVIVDIREFEVQGEGAITNVAQIADYIRALDSVSGYYPIVFMIDDACSTLRARACACVCACVCVCKCVCVCADASFTMYP